MVGLFVTTGDSGSITEASGTQWFMRRALEAQGIDLRCLQSPSPTLTSTWRFARRLLPSVYDGERSMRALAVHARRVERHLARGPEVDFVLSPGTIPIARVRTDKPIVCWADATFDSMVDFYPGFEGLAPEALRVGHMQESMALGNVTAAVYSSEWAAQSAVRDYGADPSKVHVVPFGANVVDEPAPSEVAAWIEERSARPLELLFIAVDWERKGGPLVSQLVLELRARGVRCGLTIVGADPAASGGALPPGTKITGFIDKSSVAGAGEFRECLRRASFLLLPSRAEAYGVALCEAGAYGVPVVTSDVGGITTIVRDNVNGRAFGVSSTPGEYADYVAGVWRSPEVYRRLAEGARHEYEARLNWRTAASSFVRILQDVVE